MAFQIPDDQRQHVEARLVGDLIAWFTTVRPSGMPDTVPVWFLWRDGVFVIYSEPGKQKLRNVAGNPNVSLALDDTRGGDDVVRFEGTAAVDPAQPAALRVPEYARKYGKHIERLGYGDPAAFAGMFSEPIVVVPTRYRRWA